MAASGRWSAIWRRRTVTVGAVTVAFEEEGLEDDVLGDVGAAGEGSDLAVEDLFDRGDELLRCRNLVGDPGLADALVLAHVDKLALGGQEHVLQDADERVGPGEVGSCVGWAAAELLLVQPYHRVRGRRQRRGEGLSGFRHVASCKFRPAPTRASISAPPRPWSARASRRRKKAQEQPMADAVPGGPLQRIAPNRP